MAKKQKSPQDNSQKDNSQIEEIDLSSIDLDSLAISELGEDLSFLKFEEETPKKKTEKKAANNTASDKKESKKPIHDDDFDDDFPIIELKDEPDDEDLFKDDFEDFEPDEADLLDIDTEDGYKQPKDFFTDKRRQKNLKKFLDVEVPAEYLEGLDENMQLLFKKGKVEGRLVYDEVMSALPAGDDIEFMDEVFSRLSKLGIELVDSLDQEDIFKDSGKKNEEIDLADISDDSIRMYLNEIGRFKLIDADEEIRLGRLIQK